MTRNIAFGFVLIWASFAFFAQASAQEADLSKFARPVQEFFESFRNSKIAYEQTRDDEPFAECRVSVGDGTNGMFFRSRITNGLLEEHLLHADGMYLTTDRFVSFEGRILDRGPTAKRSWSDDDLSRVDTVLFGLIWDGKQLCDLTGQEFWAGLTGESIGTAGIVATNAEGVRFEFQWHDMQTRLAIKVRYPRPEVVEAGGKSVMLEREFDFQLDDDERAVSWVIREEWEWNGETRQRTEKSKVTSRENWISNEQNIQFTEIEVKNGDVVLLPETNERFKYENGRFIK